MRVGRVDRLDALRGDDAKVHGHDGRKRDPQLERAAVDLATVLDVEGGWYATVRVPEMRSEEGWALDLLEVQARYAAGAARLLADGAAARLDVRPEVHEAFQRELAARLADSVWATCSSWYVTESGRVTNNWPGTQTEYRRRARRIDPADYVVEVAGVPSERGVTPA